MFTIHEDWHKALHTRVSTRSYAPLELAKSASEKLGHLAETVNSLNAGVRIAIIHSGLDRLFSGFIGSYGKIRGMKAVALFIGKENHTDTPGRIGYFGETVILEAERLGIATCWVSGTFDRDHAASVTRLSQGERIYSVTPLGYPAERKRLSDSIAKSIVGSAKRKPVSAIATGLVEDMPAWVDSALEAACLAPSAANLQPWRFAVEREEKDWHVILKPASNPPSDRERLDCGIAKLHFELGAAAKGVAGTWTKDPSGGEKFSHA